MSLDRSTGPIGSDAYDADADPLPRGFVPGEYDVICQRGKECFDHSGNRRFRTCVERYLSEYSSANNRQHKSRIVSKIIEEVAQGSKGEGGFVRKDLLTRRWFKVSKKQAREKVSQALRDASKSRNKAKKATPQTVHRTDLSFKNTTGIPTQVATTNFLPLDSSRSNTNSQQANDDVRKPHMRLDHFDASSAERASKRVMAISDAVFGERQTAPDAVSGAALQRQNSNSSFDLEPTPVDYWFHGAQNPALGVAPLQQSAIPLHPNDSVFPSSARIGTSHISAGRIQNPNGPMPSEFNMNSFGLQDPLAQLASLAIPQTAPRAPASQETGAAAASGFDLPVTSQWLRDQLAREGFDPTGGSPS